MYVFIYLINLKGTLFEH